MLWSELFPQSLKPGFDMITQYINSPLWLPLCRFIESTYSVLPTIEYSRCSGAMGWNVKYRKGGRALCTLYPNQNFFTCLISIGRREEPGAELLLPSCSAYLQKLYREAGGVNGSRWLMIDVTSGEILEDVKRLIQLRVPVGRRGGHA